MNKKFMLAALIAVVFLIPSHAGASPVKDVGDIVFEATGWIIGKDGVNLSFVADVAPYTYLVTLSDLSVPDNFGFKTLFLSITTASEVVDFIFGPGQFTFAATPGETYFVNIFGEGAGNLEAGLFGVEIKAIPIPTTLMLLGSGLLGLMVLRRKLR